MWQIPYTKAQSGETFILSEISFFASLLFLGVAVSFDIKTFYGFLMLLFLTSIKVEVLECHLASRYKKKDSGNILRAQLHKYTNYHGDRLKGFDVDLLQRYLVVPYNKVDTLKYLPSSITDLYQVPKCAKFQINRSFSFEI